MPLTNEYKKPNIFDVTGRRYKNNWNDKESTDCQSW